MDPSDLFKALAESLPRKIKKTRPKTPDYKKLTQYRIGQKLYSISVEDNGKCNLRTHIVRTIRGGILYAILKNEYTWGNKAAIGKRFSRTENYGWLDPIPSCWREACKVGEKFRYLHTTERAAWADPFNLRYLGDPEDAPIRKRVETQIKAALTRLKKSA